MHFTVAKRTAKLGDIIAAAYEQAASHAADSKEISRLAARAVMRFLMKTGNAQVAHKLAQESCSL